MATGASLQSAQVTIKNFSQSDQDATSAAQSVLVVCEKSDQREIRESAQVSDNLQNLRLECTEFVCLNLIGCIKACRSRKTKKDAQFVKTLRDIICHNLEELTIENLKILLDRETSSHVEIQLKKYIHMVLEKKGIYGTQSYI